MTITLASIPAYLLHVAAVAALVGCLWLWLRKELTPRRFLSIWETNGVLSSRQAAAWVVMLWSLFMRSAGRIDNEGMRIGLEMMVVLFGIGGLVQAAAKIKPGTTVNAKKISEMNVESDPPVSSAQPE